MEHIAAIMMLIGCTQGNVQCRELPAPAIGFETVDACRDLLQPAISEARGANEVVHGKCTEVDPALFIEDATIVWKNAPLGQLHVQVTFDDPASPVMVAERAGRSTVLSK
jgi:hypothetical protein